MLARALMCCKETLEQMVFPTQALNQNWLVLAAGCAPIRGNLNKKTVIACSVHLFTYNVAS